jgi:hypothetical protein
MYLCTPPASPASGAWCAQLAQFALLDSLLGWHCHTSSKPSQLSAKQSHLHPFHVLRLYFKSVLLQAVSSSANFIRCFANLKSPLKEIIKFMNIHIGHCIDSYEQLECTAHQIHEAEAVVVFSFQPLH